MKNNKQQSESLTEFKKSLFYGERNNLFFKFLGGDKYSEEEFAEFIENLLDILATSIDTNNFNSLKQFIFQAQLKGYEPLEKPDRYVYEDFPWTKFSKKLSESKLSMISTGGLFCKDDDPMTPPGMTQEEAIKNIGEIFRSPVVLSSIPNNTLRKNLVIRQPGYDIRAALIDPNVVFPYEILTKLKNNNLIKSITDNFYSFVGACNQTNLIKKAASQWVDLMISQKVDGVLLVPA
tara:strand:- start:1019 stop:1723 length:705 start_codon:yes stop_codon:yes gene_type:complete